MAGRHRAVTSLTSAQVDDLMGLYASVWWATDRRRVDVERILASTDLVVGLVDDDERLVAFARVLTDETYVALVLDVIVAEPHRGELLGAALMEAVLAEPRLERVRSVELVCQPELVGFYERWGFTADVGRSLLLRRAGPTRSG